jgi:diguanylate cyclase (GGDEF)-like protein
MKTITLGLGAGHTDLHAPLLTIVDRLLEQFIKVVEPVAPASGAQSFSATLGQRRDALVEADNREQIVSAGESLIDACRAGAGHLDQQRLQSREEITSLLALLHEAVATIAETGSCISQDVTTSVARFEALHGITDIGELKTRLAAEVGQLKHTVAERERRWTTTVSTFEQRVASLEQQLADTLEVANQDALTGCANRRGLDAAIAVACANVRMNAVLALFDVDDFKVVNDTRGHALGDDVLVAVSRALKAAVREQDLVGRLGGDEFAVLLRGITLPTAERRIQVMLKSLADQPVVPDVRVTLSCGMAEFSAGDTPASLLLRADHALYEAKHSGKGRGIAKTTSLIRDLFRRS